MPVLGTLRRLALAPSLREVSFSGRGFTVPDGERTRRLEAVPQAVVTGFEWGIEDRDLATTERRLALIDPEQRGFAYEGATMACAVRDAMGRSGHRTRDLLTGGGRPHIFLNYIGIGFAMAKLPRPLWKKIVPDLSGAEYYPAMSWLCVDGYGFDRAYFDTDTWVTGQRLDDPYDWDGDPSYWHRAFDQGVGRALWFIHGGDVRNVAAAVRAFAGDRQADLWSGVGLAATFAGGGTPAELALLREESGPGLGHLAQGSVFAAKARHHAGFVPGHTEAAVGAFTGLSAEAAARLADDCAPAVVRDAGVPAYEVWRTRVRERLAVIPAVEHV
ncbi:DUF1702 family protein [Streptomyces griseoflavus]|uniref:DUF1702 family protein n=1 Tax=Streptomyces griseoflavus TaxID=35619 RepID=UPI00167EA01E|nr:DUF1702 family protein [Streptomyces griseoflavus]GGV45148.1 hypothetical protein GCM10010293_52880 [Streptomyces griseoflavus]